MSRHPGPRHARISDPENQRQASENIETTNGRVPASWNIRTFDDRPSTSKAKIFGDVDDLSFPSGPNDDRGSQITNLSFLGFRSNAGGELFDRARRAVNSQILLVPQVMHRSRYDLANQLMLRASCLASCLSTRTFVNTEMLTMRGSFDVNLPPRSSRHWCREVDCGDHPFLWGN